jgi:DNA polymerase
MNTSSKQQLLEQIKADIIADDVCPDLAKTAKHLVMGDGSPNAEVLFIGEAPGKNEDEQGLPFVGAAGKFLGEMLKSIGMERQDVYISNIVKYRPPDNRDPLPAEKEAFWPYLLRQIKVINPKLVVTLGRHSMEYFLPNCRISQVHGQPKRRGDLVIMPLFHPAAALYNSSMRETLLEDFAKIPKTLELIKRKEE